REAGPALLVFVAIFCLRSIAVVIQQAQLGLQQGYIANAWTAIGNLCALAGLFVAAELRAGVPVLCLVVTGLPVAAGLANTAWWLSTRLPARPPNQSSARDRQLVIRMLSVGMLFF